MKTREGIICVAAGLFLASLFLVFSVPSWGIREASAQTSPTFNLVTNATQVDSTSFIHIVGTLSESKTGTVVLQWAINSSGFIYTHNEQMTNGVVQRDFGFSSGPGTWQLRYYWPGDGTSNPATSNVITITVTPAPSPTPTPTTTPTPTPTATPSPTAPPTASPTSTSSSPTSAPPPTTTAPTYNPTYNPTTTPLPSATTPHVGSPTPSASPFASPTETATPSETPSQSPDQSTGPTYAPGYTPGGTSTSQTSVPSQSPAASSSPSSNATRIEASVWVPPPPANSVTATVIAAGAVGGCSVAVAAAIAPVGAPTGTVAGKVRDILPSSFKEWLADFVKSKRKMTVTEKKGSRFVPTKTEAVAYAVSIGVLAVSFSYVKANNLTEILSVLPMILATSIFVSFVKIFVSIVYSRHKGVWTEIKLWYFGLATFLVTTFAFRMPFSSPSRTVHHSEKYTKRLGAVLAVTSILMDFAFAGLFGLLLLGGFALVGSTGLAMCLISAFFNTFPVSPMNGKDVFDHSRLLWAVMFVVTLCLYGAWLMLM